LQTNGDDGGLVVPLLVGVGEQSFLESLQRASAESSGLRERVACSALAMAQILGVDLDRSRCPFFNIGLAIGDRDTNFNLEDYPVDLAICFDTAEGLIKGRIVYAADLFETSTIERVRSLLTNATSRTAHQPDVSISEIDLIPADERHRILRTFQGAAAPYPLGKTLHGLFEEQARRTPDAVAAIYQATRLTYADLDARANRVAHLLLSLGLKKGEFVGILVHRSCEFVIAMLGVFKAGGDYVPLDPTYPGDRIKYMIDDSQMAMILSTASLVEAFAETLKGSERVTTVVTVDAAASTNRARFKSVGTERIDAAPGQSPAVPQPLVFCP
jgi:non-ribosomal peptide synthetase component F